MDAFTAHKAMCMICHTKNNTSKLNKLKQIKHVIDMAHVQPTEDRFHPFMWDVDIRCDYGISCSKLNSTNHTAQHLAYDIGKYLITIAKNDDAKLYHQILQYLRGDFSTVYIQFERLHHCYHKKED